MLASARTSGDRPGPVAAGETSRGTGYLSPWDRLRDDANAVFPAQPPVETTSRSRESQCGLGLCSAGSPSRIDEHSTMHGQCFGLLPTLGQCFQRRDGDLPSSNSDCTAVQNMNETFDISTPVLEASPRSSDTDDLEEMATSSCSSDEEESLMQEEQQVLLRLQGAQEEVTSLHARESHLAYVAATLQMQRDALKIVAKQQELTESARREEFERRALECHEAREATTRAALKQFRQDGDTVAPHGTTGPGSADCRKPRWTIMGWDDLRFIGVTLMLWVPLFVCTCSGDMTSASSLGNGLDATPSWVWFCLFLAFLSSALVAESARWLSPREMLGVVLPLARSSLLVVLRALRVFLCFVEKWLSQSGKPPQTAEIGVQVGPSLQDSADAWLPKRLLALASFTLWSAGFRKSSSRSPLNARSALVAHAVSYRLVQWVEQVYQKSRGLASTNIRVIERNR